MAQLFRSGANTIVRLALAAIVVVPLGAALLAWGIARSPYTTGEGRFVDQAVPFSHKHHVGDLGLDCRMCHYGVERGARAVVPPTHVCMTCHSQLWTNAAMLAPVRRSMASGRPLGWSRVTRVPDYVYFNHHVHVANGVPCAACHGAVDEMPLMRQAKPMTMQWCLACHRDPERRLVPPARIYDPRPYLQPIAPEEARRIHARVAGLDRKRLTDCSTCHR